MLHRGDVLPWVTEEGVQLEVWTLGDDSLFHGKKTRGDQGREVFRAVWGSRAEVATAVLPGLRIKRGSFTQ